MQLKQQCEMHDNFIIAIQDTPRQTYRHLVSFGLNKTAHSTDY